MKTRNRFDYITNQTVSEKTKDTAFYTIHPISVKAPLELKDEQTHIFVKNGKMNQRVNYSDIIYLQAQGSYCQIITKTQKQTVSMSLVKVLQQLESSLFLRCHRSYAINKDLISAFDDSHLYLDHGDPSIKLPFSRSYRLQLLNKLNRLNG